MNGITENVQGTVGTDAEQQQEQKTFTQEEVDGIVEKRLARERKKFSGMLAGKDPKELELDEREKAVAKKEMRLSVRSTLSEYEISEEALELLNYENEEKLQESIEILRNAINAAVERRVHDLLKGGRPLKKAPPYEPQNTTLRDAFGLQKR